MQLPIGFPEGRLDRDRSADAGRDTAIPSVCRAEVRHRPCQLPAARRRNSGGNTMIRFATSARTCTCADPGWVRGPPAHATDNRDLLFVGDGVAFSVLPKAQSGRGLRRDHRAVAALSNAQPGLLGPRGSGPGRAIVRRQPRYLGTGFTAGAALQRRHWKPGHPALPGRHAEGSVHARDLVMWG